MIFKKLSGYITMLLDAFLWVSYANTSYENEALRIFLLVTASILLGIFWNKEIL